MTSPPSLRSASFWLASRDGHEVGRLRRSRAWRCEPAPLWSVHCNVCGQSRPVTLPSRIDHSFRDLARTLRREQCAHLWRCGTRQRGEASHPGGWKSPRRRQRRRCHPLMRGRPVPRRCAPREASGPSVQVRPGRSCQALAAALLSAAGGPHPPSQGRFCPCLKPAALTRPTMQSQPEADAIEVSTVSPKGGAHLPDTIQIRGLERVFAAALTPTLSTSAALLL